MFIGREGELDSLNRLYASNKYEFAAIYGHRRVGKTALITQFIKDKKAIYFMGVESNARQNLENFSKNILEFGAGIPVEAAFVFFNLHWNMFLSWRKALGLIQKETSYGEKVSRKSIYTIADNMFRFWYRFVSENHSIIGRGPLIWIIEELSRTCRIIWGRCLRRYVSSTSGDYCWLENLLWNLESLAVGGVLTRLPESRQKLILWANRIKTLRYLASVNGLMKKLMWVFWKRWLSVAKCFAMGEYGCICLLKMDLQRVVRTLRKRWGMSGL